MYKLTLINPFFKLSVSLIFVSFTVILIFSNICLAQMDKNSDQVKTEQSVERFTDFTEGEIEQIDGGMLTLNGTEYIFSEKTVFTNISDDTLTANDIQKGDLVRITFSPLENDLLLEAILQKKANEKEPEISSPQPVKDKTPEVITLKNGVYSN